jgi:hypothetical protein
MSKIGVELLQGKNAFAGTIKKEKAGEPIG